MKKEKALWYVLENDSQQCLYSKPVSKNIQNQLCGLLNVKSLHVSCR